MQKKKYPNQDNLDGIKLSTIFSGIKEPFQNKDDLLLIELDKNSSIGGIFTKSLTASAPVIHCKNNLKSSVNPSIRAILVNSGNANAFTGYLGDRTVENVTEFLSKKLNCETNQIYTASTGVIGEVLNPEIIINGLRKMSATHQTNWFKAADTIRTTDTFAKVASRKCLIDNIEIDIIGIAKGSGMIAPDMATMLGFVFTNANIPSDVLQKLLQQANETSFNSITVDSDTSTSDSVLFVSTRKAKHPKVNNYSDARLRDFKKNLKSLMLELAKLIVKDGEGASKFITINISGASSKKAAKKIAFSIANSPLVKTAIAGEDANWGRIVMAIGKSGERADRDKIKIYIGDELVTDKGMRAKTYSETNATKHLKEKEITISADVGIGIFYATVYTCDLTHEYININADYRS
jgi:glutamate N-acetyltransferase/amino-acid N-acetyltransferase